MIFFIIISATCFAYVYRSLGGDDIVEHLILEAGLTSWQLLILLMVITFFLGFFLDWIEITLIVLPVFAPLIAGLDFWGSYSLQGHHILVLDPNGHQSTNILPHATFWLCPVLPQGYCTQKK
ncbi:MAG: hypothetical protein CM1200mP18_16070 [Gammaproteobacteria bacterium]|nr:MAG: hypothetical protein CM1200mP18_16070 [Gammaproteobacteria bacterium]